MNETCQINDDILKAWTDFQRDAPQKETDIIERKKKGTRDHEIVVKGGFVKMYIPGSDHKGTFNPSISFYSCHFLKR